MSVYGAENLRPGEKFNIPKGGSAESSKNILTKCPNCGARYTTRIYKCDYCGLGPNKG